MTVFCDLFYLNTSCIVTVSLLHIVNGPLLHFGKFRPTSVLVGMLWLRLEIGLSFRVYVMMKHRRGQLNVSSYLQHVAIGVWHYNIASDVINFAFQNFHLCFFRCSRTDTEIGNASGTWQ